MKNNKTIVTKEMIRIKSGHGSQRRARYQDECSTDRRPEHKQNSANTLIGCEVAHCLDAESKFRLPQFRPFPLHSFSELGQNLQAVLLAIRVALR
jgi:hypothetical protein